GRDGAFRWYEDDGTTLECGKGRVGWTRLRWADRERRLSIEPEGGRGAFPAGPRTFVVELVPGGKRQTVRYAGRRLEVRFESGRLPRRRARAPGRMAGAI